MRLSTVLAILGIAASVIGIAINFAIIVPTGGTIIMPGPPRDVLGTQVLFWSFFTHLTNLALVFFYLADLTGARWLSALRRPVWQASMAASITLVMVFFHFLLAPYFPFTGPLLVASWLCHYIAPLIYLAWWAFCIPHGSLRLSQIPLMLLPGALYVAIILVRGAFVAEYPYPILDVALVGYGRVAIGVGIVLVAVALFCALLVGIDRLLGRRTSAA